MLELILTCTLGALVGTTTGLIPGLHNNLISVIFLSLLGATSILLPLPAAAFVVSVAIAHTFSSFIPSVYLGAPDEDSFLSVLPGHQMLKEGRGHEAVILTLYGSLLALPVIILFSPLFLFALKEIPNQIISLTPFILIFFSLFLIFSEENFLFASFSFILAGILGFASLNVPVKEPLLPLLSGLFGASALVISMKDKMSVSGQSTPKLKEIKLSKRDLLRPLFGSILSAPLCSFLPGIGSGHAAALSSEMIKQTQRGFLVLVGAINTIVMGLSIVALYGFGRTRSGAAVAVKEIIPQVSISEIITLIVVIIFAGLFSFIISVPLSKYSAKNISKINYFALSVIVLVILASLTIIFSGPLGLIIFIASSSLGAFTILSGARRINLMGCLLLPTILFYLFS